MKLKLKHVVLALASLFGLAGSITVAQNINGNITSGRDTNIGSTVIQGDVTVFQNGQPTSVEIFQGGNAPPGFEPISPNSDGYYVDLVAGDNIFDRQMVEDIRGDNVYYLNLQFDAIIQIEVECFSRTTTAFYELTTAAGSSLGAESNCRRQSQVQVDLASDQYRLVVSTSSGDAAPYRLRIIASPV